MLMLLSPSKTQDFDSPLSKALPKATAPFFPEESAALIALLRKQSPAKLQKLMEISPRLAALNHQRYRDFTQPFTPANARPCLAAFQGDVYDGLAAESMTKADHTFAQKHLRILSGLYGLLRPLDLIQPYRLEMSIRLANGQGRDLYAFWGSQLAEALNEAARAAKMDCVVNLASEEYSTAIDRKVLKARIISPQFKEEKISEEGGTQLRILALFAKRARGAMARHLIDTRATGPEALESFNTDGYRYRADLSTQETPVFSRPQPATKAA